MKLIWKIRSASKTQELIDAGCTEFHFIDNLAGIVQIGRLDQVAEFDQQEGIYWLNAHENSNHCNVTENEFNASINLSPNLSDMFGYNTRWIFPTILSV